MNAKDGGQFTEDAFRRTMDAIWNEPMRGPSVEIGPRCRTCNGTGKDLGRVCGDCAGYGVLTPTSRFVAAYRKTAP